MPNILTENRLLWKNIQQKLENQSNLEPDVVLSDSNIVKDGIDQLPYKHNNATAIENLQELRNHLNLIDGWRTISPNYKCYTHTQKPAMKRARLDQIYGTQKIVETATDWDIDESGVETDHNLVSVIITNPKVLFIGRGRWTLPMFLLKDKEFKKKCHKIVN